MITVAAQLQRHEEITPLLKDVLECCGNFDAWFGDQNSVFKSENDELLVGATGLIYRDFVAPVRQFLKSTSSHFVGLDASNYLNIKKKMDHFVSSFQSDFLNLQKKIESASESLWVYDENLKSAGFPYYSRDKEIPDFTGHSSDKFSSLISLLAIHGHVNVVSELKEMLDILSNWENFIFPIISVSWIGAEPLVTIRVCKITEDSHVSVGKVIRYQTRNDGEGPHYFVSDHTRGKCVHIKNLDYEGFDHWEEDCPRRLGKPCMSGPMASTYYNPVWKRGQGTDCWSHYGSRDIRDVLRPQSFGDFIREHICSKIESLPRGQKMVSSFDQLDAAKKIEEAAKTMEEAAKNLAEAQRVYETLSKRRKITEESSSSH